MLKITLHFMILCFCMTANAGDLKIQALERHFEAEEAALNHASSVFLVTAEDWTKTLGQGQVYRKVNSQFRKVGSEIPLVLGRSGMAWGIGVSDYRRLDGPVKREGDGKSPAGFFKLRQSFGVSKIGNLPFLNVTRDHVCVDDSRSRVYNRIVDRTQVSKDWESFEEMAIPLYRYGIEVAHNYLSPEALGGSCIFIHLWRGPESSTSGCTAMDEANILKVLQNLDSSSLIIQMPYFELKAFPLTSFEPL